MTSSKRSKSSEDSEDEATLQLSEETARVNKRLVETGRVVIRTVVDEAEQLAKATLATDTVEVTHVPVNREVSVAPAVRSENGVTIIPVLEEIMVVEKRLLLKEELHVRRRTTKQPIEFPVKLRKERAVVERIATDPTNKTRSSDD
jgi:stress response protein YsnF